MDASKVMESMHTHFLSLMPMYYDHITTEIAALISKENNLEFDKVLAQINDGNIKDDILKSVGTKPKIVKTTEETIHIPDIPVSEMGRQDLQKLAKMYKSQKIADISGRQTTVSLRNELMKVNVPQKRQKTEDVDDSDDITNIVFKIKHGTINVSEFDVLSRKQVLSLAKHYKINGKQKNEVIIEELKTMVSNNPDDGFKLQILNGNMERKTLERLEYDEIVKLGDHFNLEKDAHHQLVNQLREITKTNAKQIEQNSQEIDPFEVEEFDDD